MNGTLFIQESRAIEKNFKKDVCYIFKFAYNIHDQNQHGSSFCLKYKACFQEIDKQIILYF